MPTETEIKLQMDDPSIIQKVQESEFVTRFIREGFQTIQMHSVYYDTPNWDLFNAGYHLRIRSDGTMVVASLKQGSIDKEKHKGLCIRKKWLCTAESVDTAIDRLLMLGAPEELRAIVGNRPLLESASATFTRTQNTLYMENGQVAELAMDNGTLSAGGKTMPFLEMELEILFGNLNAFHPFCDGLSQRFGLSPAVLTKYEKAHQMAVS